LEEPGTAERKSEKAVLLHSVFYYVHILFLVMCVLQSPPRLLATSRL